MTREQSRPSDVLRALSDGCDPILAFPNADIPPLPSDGVSPARAAVSAVEEMVALLMDEQGAVSFPWQYRIAKRVLDLAIATLLLIVAAPLFLIIAILIELDSPGAVFFVQERPGRLGRPFPMIKFRTMYSGSERFPGKAGEKRRIDRRVTRVGRILRQTSMDELPQLINVLVGHMSLVGPRPEITKWVLDSYDRWHYRRFVVPQGMTGWWQVTGRSSKSHVEKLRDDVYYIQHASFWFDVKILFMTFRAIIKREGAF